MTVFVQAAPRPARNGLISAFILSAGLALALGAGLGDAYLRKDVTVVIAGQIIPRTTYTRTVAQALAEAGVVLQVTDEVSPPLETRLAEGMRVEVRHAVPVTLVADGQVVSVLSAAATVGDLLGRRNIVPGDGDVVVPAAETPLSEGLLIRIVRIAHRVVTEQMLVPYEVQTSRDPTVPRGMIRVLRPGRSGVTERLVKITTADGVVVSKDPLGERVVRTPLDRVILFGTLVRIAAAGPFAGREYLDMLATAYSPYCCLGVDDITSTGLKAGFGVVAVDPAVIRLGSRLYVEGYGYAIAGDVGGGIKGLRIDLGFNTKREALMFGVRNLRVYLLASK